MEHMAHIAKVQALANLLHAVPVCRCTVYSEYVVQNLQIISMASFGRARRSGAVAAEAPTEDTGIVAEQQTDAYSGAQQKAQYGEDIEDMCQCLEKVHKNACSTCGRITGTCWPYFFCVVALAAGSAGTACVTAGEVRPCLHYTA